MKQQKKGSQEVYVVAALGALVIAMWSFALSAADINKGYTFLPTDNVTSTKLNNLVDLASIAPTFITAQAADLNLAGADTMVLYSVSGSGLRKATLNTLAQQFWTNTAQFSSLSNNPTPAPAQQMIGYNAAGGLELVYRTNLSWERYTSPAFAFTYGYHTNLAHGLTNTPQFVSWVLKCVSQQNGYYPGDEISVHDVFAYELAGGNNYCLPAFASGANSTNVWIHCATNASLVLPNGYALVAATNTVSPVANSILLTNADWQLKCYARYWP